MHHTEKENVAHLRHTKLSKPKSRSQHLKGVTTGRASSRMDCDLCSSKLACKSRERWSPEAGGRLCTRTADGEHALRLSPPFILRKLYAPGTSRTDPGGLLGSPSSHRAAGMVHHSPARSGRGKHPVALKTPGDWCPCNTWDRHLATSS